MVRTRGTLVCLFASVALGQQGIGDPAAIRAGAPLYRERCGMCHGADARGGEAPNLTRSQLVVAGAPKDLFTTIHRGIPGTEMPALDLPDEPVWQIVAWLYSIARPGMGSPVAGDVTAGRQIFERSGCIDCHMIAGRGGFLGPDLSSVALRRFTSQIRDQILHPGAAVPFGFQPVKATTVKGARIAGLLKNEDNFSVQILQPDGAYALLMRGAIRELRLEPATLMPDVYAANLDQAALQNLLAYLDQQRAPATAADIRPVAY